MHNKFLTVWKRFTTMFLIALTLVCLNPASAAAASDPYYVDIKISGVTTDTAVITASLKNHSGNKLTEGGFYLSQKSGTSVQSGTKKTDKIAESWQKAANLPCSYNLKKEYGITLKPNTTYYVVLYCKNSNGKMFYSKEFSFTTAKGINYSDVSVKSVMTNTAVITANINNPNAVKLTKGGFSIGTKSGTCMANGSGVDIISSTWQTAKTLPCSYDFKNEYGITLKPNTTYYVVLYCQDSSGNKYFSKEVSFMTAATKNASASSKLAPGAFYQNGKGESAAFDMPNSACYVNSYAMIFQMLGNANATPTSIYEFNGNTVYCKGTSTIANHYGFNAIRADRLSAYGNFKNLSVSEQEKALKKALGNLPSNERVCNLNVFGSNGSQIHMAMAYLDSNGNLLVRDPGYSESSGCDIYYSKFISQLRRDVDPNAYVYNFWYFTAR